MKHPFTTVLFTERCPVCGGTYQVSLYDVAREQQLAGEWRPARPCSGCGEYQLRLAAAIPKAKLTAAMQAWDDIAAALEERGLAYELNTPAGPSTGIQHQSGIR